MIKTNSNEVLDCILQYCIENKDVNSDKIINDLFPDVNIDQLSFMLNKIMSCDVKVLNIEEGHYTVINSTGMTKDFLNNGGFSSLFEKQEKELKLKQEKDDIEFRKSKIDLELSENMLKEYPNTKLFARIGFVIAICLALLELGKLIIQLMSSD